MNKEVFFIVAWFSIVWLLTGLAIGSSHCNSSWQKKLIDRNYGEWAVTETGTSYFVLKPIEVESKE